MENEYRSVGAKAGVAIAIVIFSIGVYWFLADYALFPADVDGDALRDRILRLGNWGPFAVISLMAVAIVLSPLPSAPIAWAAGAAYGHTWGTVFVLIGSEIGALIAFSIARLLGHEFLKRWFGNRLSLGFLGSQNTLMAIVFVSRLFPFLSFDIVSYAAGLTPLNPWRFALATLAGILPASFLLAHFGDEMASAEMGRVIIAILALGAITLIPIAIKVMRSRR